MKLTRKLSAAFLFIAAGLLFTAAGAVDRPGGGNQALLLAADVNECTERYNYCVESCERYRSDCVANGNDAEYCAGQYTYCQNQCQNRMKQCWSE